MQQSAVSLVLVDFDDTLVDTAPRFQNARRSLFSRLEALGATADLIQRIHHDRIDPLMLERYGLGPARLEHSFRATYEAVCLELGLPVDEEVAERCMELGRAVAGTPPILEGALTALERLARQFRTVVYTQAGNRDYQTRCVQEAGVSDVAGLEAVHICELKTVVAFRETLELLGVTDVERVWMVGNSIRSDINPALEAGANAILVEVAEPWEFDLVEPVSNDFVRARTFSEAVDFLLRLDG
ncbi:MAG: HAD family hydrolase [Gemmatimonadota bacterium]